MKKRIVTFALAVLMIAALIPMTATPSSAVAAIEAWISGDAIFWKPVKSAQLYVVSCGDKDATYYESGSCDLTGLLRYARSGSYSVSVGAYTYSTIDEEYYEIARSDVFTYDYTSPYSVLPEPVAGWEGTSIRFERPLMDYSGSGINASFIRANIQLFEDGVNVANYERPLSDNVVDISWIITNDAPVYRFVIWFDWDGSISDGYMLESDAFESEEVYGRQLKNGYRLVMHEYDDAQFTVGTEADFTFNVDRGPYEILSVELTSSEKEMPAGMRLEYGSLGAYLRGTPSKAGKYEPEFQVTMYGGHVVYYQLSVIVLSDVLLDTAEIMAIPLGQQGSYDMLIDRPSAYHSVSKISGSLPDGMDWSWGEVTAPKVYGKPTAAGVFTSAYSVTFSNGERRKHNVDAVVYDSSKAIGSFPIDLSHNGETVMPLSVFRDFIENTLTASRDNDKEIALTETSSISGSVYDVDLDKDGTDDLCFTYKKTQPDRVTVRALAGRSVRRSYELKLGFMALAGLSGTKNYSREIHFTFPALALESYTVDISSGECVIPVEDYINSLLFSLNAAWSAGQIDVGTESGRTVIDLDNDGTWDVDIWTEWEGYGQGTHFALRDGNSLGGQNFNLKLSGKALSSITHEYYTKAIFFRIKMNNPFTDVPEGKWYTNAVLYCYANGYMAGTSDSTFAPNSSFTRAMFVTVLAKIDGADTSAYSGSSFTDVPEGKWYSKPVQWAYQNEFAAGLGGGRFGPNDPVTREQIAQFLYNYTQKRHWGVEGSSDLSGYPDADKVSNYAKNAVKWAVHYGLISGVKVGDTVYLQPKGTATRAQVAVIVKNITSWT